MTNGAICVNTLKKDWTADTTFSHVLSAIRCLLIVPFPESSLNDEAGKYSWNRTEEYAKRAKLMADIHGRPKPSDPDARGQINGS
jgi:ubiquitin-conjugating enzyme E2 S